MGGGLCPGGGSLSGRGISVRRGIYVRKGSLSRGRSPFPYGYVRTVRILLECILVMNVDWFALSSQMFFKLSYW